MTDKPKSNILRLVPKDIESDTYCEETVAGLANVNWTALVVSGWIESPDGTFEHVVWACDSFQDAIWLLERAKLQIMADHDAHFEE